MKDEIREILQTLGGIASGDWIQMLPKEANKLLDYITNLQQDYDNEAEENLKLSEWLVEKQQRIEELEEINKQHQELNGTLRNEDERLKEALFKSVNNTNNSMELTEYYKSRCEKAIEYINDGYLSDGEMVNILAQKDLLNILQDKEEV